MCTLICVCKIIVFLLYCHWQSVRGDLNENILKDIYIDPCISSMHCLHSYVSITSNQLVGKLAELKPFRWCVKSGVTAMVAIARLVLVEDMISWHAASETAIHSAPCLLPHCSCQLE